MTALLPNLWGSDNSVPLDEEQAIEAISNSRRRHVLMMLDDRAEPQPVGDLADAISAIECDKDIQEITSAERKRVYVALIQIHLDTLDEVSAIVYDQRSKMVYPTDATSGLADLVQHLESVCDPADG